MKIKNILLVVVAGIALTGAACKKILNQPVLGSYTPGDFFTSDANAQLAVNEAYKYLAFNSGATNAIWVLGDLASDDAVKGGSSVGDQADFQAVNQFEILPTNSAVEAVWGNYYNGVFACNVVTDGLTGNSAVSANMQQQGIAQARFLRAYYYFILTLCYGNIPLHLTVQTATEAQTPALPQDTIFTQIENDCIAAAAVLPTSVPAAQLGQATKGAALALLAKTYLFHSDLANHYTLAAQTAQQVVALGYSLTNRYWDNFDANTKNNSEEIFTVNHIAGTLGLGNELNVWFAPRSPAAPAGYGFFLPTQSLVNNYETAPDGTPDPRLDYTIARGTHPYFDIPYDSTWSSTGYMCKKMCQPLSEVPAATKNVGTVNYEALRLSDILLVEAEALNESGQSAAALAPLNQVRERARNSYMYDSSLTGYPNVPAGLLPDITITDQGQLRTIIQRERRSELALEFHRFFDLMRYGSTIATAAITPGAPNFNYANNKWFPLPQSERDANPNLFKYLTYIAYGVAIVFFVGVVASCKKSSSPASYNTNKAGLIAAIDSLTNVYNTTVDGTKPGQYAPGARAALDSVIALATTVSSSSTYTQQQVNNALNNLLAAGVTFSSQLIQQVSSANLMGYWEFNGNAMDSSGNGNNGVLQTGWVGVSAATAVDGGTLPVLVPDRFGRANMAYYFNNGATVKIPFNSVFNAQTFTILLWLKRDGTNANNYMFSFDRWLGYKFQLQSGNLPFLTVNTSTGDHDQDDGGIAIDSAGVWRHVAVSFTPGTEKFYIQGKLVSTETVTGTPLPISSVINIAIGNELPKENYNLTNSNDPNYFYGGDYFMGALDEVRFYNTVLTDAEILSIYTDESSL